MASGNMKTRWTQQREQGGSSITSLKNKLPSDAAETKSQAANRIFQCRLGEGVASFMSGDLSPKWKQMIDRRGATQECTLRRFGRPSRYTRAQPQA